jgi:transcriptional regulator with XRE-family HTH domain
VENLKRMHRLGNRVRRWERDNRLSTGEAAEKLGMLLERYVQIKSLGRPTPQEIDKIVAATGVSRKWLEAWAHRPFRTAL